MKPYSDASITAERDSSRPAPRRSHDPEGVKRNILDIAREEFVENGFSGARVDHIAARTATSKRMIYYYFRDKEGLYIAVLEEAYAAIRSLEARASFEDLSPVEALRKLAQITFDYHAANPAFVRLVMIENIHNGKHLAKSAIIQSLNLAAIAQLDMIYQKGVAAGQFRPGIDPLDLHLTVSALSFYNVSNRATIKQVFNHDMGGHSALENRRSIMVETVLRFVAI